MSEFEMRWVDEYLKRAPDVVFDVGSYNGGDAVRFKQAYPKARVVAIEACPKNVWQMKMRPLAVPGIEILHYAVCDRVGTAQFTSSESRIVGNGSGSIHQPNELCRKTFPHINFLPPVEVPCITLRALCDKLGVSVIDVIHADVQGAEGQMLKGLGDMRPKIVFIETAETERYAGAMPLPELQKLLADMGYKLAKTLQWDALYVHEGA